MQTILVVFTLICAISIAVLLVVLWRLTKLNRLARKANSEISSLELAIRGGLIQEEILPQDHICRKAIDLVRDAAGKKIHIDVYPVHLVLTLVPDINIKELWDRYWELHLQVEALSASREGANV
jgi:uncharacterized protein YoxC